MFNKNHILFTIGVLATLAYCDAFADLDYQCLSVCKRNGETTNVCTPKCTYVSEQEIKKQAPKTKSDPHMQFNDMHPAYQTMLTRDHSATVTAQKDFQCVATCEQGHMAYQYCQQYCMHADSALTKRNP